MELAWIWMQISKRHAITSEMHLEKNPLPSLCHTILTLLLFDCFDEPVMQNANPNLPAMMLAVMKRPSVIGKMRPVSTLERGLAKQFSDPRLQQLFGRYATYVGGMPQTAPRSFLSFGKPRQKASGRSMAECTNWHASSKRSASNAGLNSHITAVLSRSKNGKKLPLR